jgi:hypothetical protein
MTHYINPFARGFDNFSIRRLLMITVEDDCPATYVPLHPSRAHLADSGVQRFPCIFCDDFALITEGQVISDDLDTQCRGDGLVRKVLYEITALSLGTHIHVGDHYSLESAQHVVKHLTFETGHYSRCLEISSAHLSNQAMQYLAELADSDEPSGLMFEAFRVPGCFALGCKLYGTPWTDQNLAAIDGHTAVQLRDEQLHAGVPESLLDVLHLAALADTRFLIFDPDASELDGLPTSGE